MASKNFELALKAVQLDLYNILQSLHIKYHLSNDEMHLLIKAIIANLSVGNNIRFP